MKKITIILLMIFTCTFAQAQNISTITVTVNKQKQPSSAIKAIRGGFSYMDSRDDAYSSGANLSFLYLRTFGKSPFYWAVEGGFGTRALNGHNNYNQNPQDYSGFHTNLLVAAQLLPAVGWRPQISTTKKNYFDIHLGPYAAYDLFPIDGYHIKKDQYNSYYYGVAIGAGFWFNRFNLDLTYQRGFSADEDCPYAAYDIYDTDTLMLRVGYAF